MNPHWIPGETSAQHARHRGWEVGTRIVGDEGYGPQERTITAVGRETILAVGEDGLRERTLTLRFRDWQEVDA